jgi:hypothetical protein
MSVLPTDRDSFKQFILSRLGAGAIDINVTDTQVDNRINFAIRKAMDYHVDFTQMVFLTTQVTANVAANGYIDLPDNIQGVVDIFDLSSTLMGSGIFNAQYQFVMDNFQHWTSMSVIPYFIAFQNLKLIQDLLVGKQPIRYNRFKNRLYIDMDYNRIAVGGYFVIRAYEVIDADTYPRIFQDIWLIEYATAQVKQQWGEQLKKYGEMPLPGGIKVNGQKIWDEATEEILRLEDLLIGTYSLPSQMFIG